MVCRVPGYPLGAIGRWVSALDRLIGMPYTRDDCLFCKIVTGSIPADEVHRDDHVVAFRDINPQAPTHILLVPTTHYDNAAEVAADDPHGAGCAGGDREGGRPGGGHRPIGLPACSPTPAPGRGRRSSMPTCTCWAAGNAVRPRLRAGDAATPVRKE